LKEEFSREYFVRTMASGGYAPGTADYALNQLVGMGLVARVGRGRYRLLARRVEVKASWAGEALLQLLGWLGEREAGLELMISALRTAFLELARAGRLNKGSPELEQIRGLTRKLFLKAWGLLRAQFREPAVVRILYSRAEAPAWVLGKDVQGLLSLIRLGLLEGGRAICVYFVPEWWEVPVSELSPGPGPPPGQRAS